MLPDYPDVKKDLAAKLQDFLQKRMRIHLGALDDIRTSQYFEGDQHSITREDGDTEINPFHRMTSEISIDKADLPKMSLEEALKRLDDVAADMARQHADMVYGTISEAVDKVGNVVDAKGKGITAALIIETLEKLHIDSFSCGRSGGGRSMSSGLVRGLDDRRGSGSYRGYPARGHSLRQGLNKKS